MTTLAKALLLVAGWAFVTWTITTLILMTKEKEYADEHQDEFTDEYEDSSISDSEDTTD